MSPNRSPSSAPERKPFWVKCEKCAHCWIAAYYPCPIEIFVKAGKRQICPMCGNGPSGVVVAKQDDGVLQEAAT